MKICGGVWFNGSFLPAVIRALRLPFAKEAERLITQEKVCTIFGCWTSASRKNVKPVVERYNHLLIYPMAYEGLEESPNIIYTGAAPNQQVIPAVKWSYDTIGKRIFL